MSEYGVRGWQVKGFYKTAVVKAAREPGHKEQAIILLSRGDGAQALERLLLCLKQTPMDLEAHQLAGLVLAELGQPIRALQHLDFVKTQGGSETASAHFHSNYGNVLAQLGRLDEAMEAYDTALRFNADDADALLNKGNLLLRLERYSEALELYDQSLMVRSDFALTHGNRGLALWALGNLQLAQLSFQRALTIQPNSAAYHCFYGSLCLALHKYQEAKQYLEMAIRLDESYGPAYFELGNAQMLEENYQAAKNSYLKAMRLRGADLIHIYANLAICSYYLLDTLAVDEYLDKRFALINDFRGKWLHVMTRIPRCPDTPRQAQDARKSFERELLVLKDWLSKNGVADFEKSIGDGGMNTSYYAWHGIDDRHLLELYASVVKMLVEPFAVDLPVKARPIRKKIRIGIISAHLFDNPVWQEKILGVYLGKPNDFEIYTFSTGNDGLKEQEIVKKQSAFYGGEALEFKGLVAAIKDSELDVIYYPEIGLNATVHKLACLRLAPVQLTSWGNPVTSGVESIDYFIGNNFISENDPQKYYSEKLLLQKCFPIYFDFYDAVEGGSHKDFHEIDFSKKIILEKDGANEFRFNFEKLYADISEILHDIQIVLVNSGGVVFERNKEKLLKEFMARGIDEKKLIFIDNIDQKSYRYLQQKSYLMLDGFGRAGMHAVLQALNAKLPVVAYRGNFLRNRLGSGVLDAVGMGGWVADSHEAYVAQVCKLVQDENYRARYLEDLREVSGQLFENRSCIEEFFETIRSLHFGNRS